LSHSRFLFLFPVYRKEHDLQSLSQLGHFLKGSSASIGLKHMRESCQQIQQLSKDSNAENAWSVADTLLIETREHFRAAKEYLVEFYHLEGQV
jgi:osomolarity two-component system phosphorelay intermediate protein YPD1